MGDLICGDAREELAKMPEESVHCVITSPPYWGLRSYEGTECVFGGDEGCEHEWGGELYERKRGALHGEGARAGNTLSGVSGIGVKQGSFCSLCGAWRGQYGLEPTPEMYVEHTLEFLRAIWRVLRKDGTVWWNIGDSYAGGKGQSGVKSQEYQSERVARGLSINRRQQVGGPGQTRALDDTRMLRIFGIKPKDLVMIPFRVALAAQADGWWVRQVIIWEKPNPMPESVTDRCTTSHEYVLLMTKSGEPQYWTHRDHNGTRKKPKPDYRWVNQVTEEEVTKAPPDWRKKIVCPKCQGTKKVTYTEMVMGAEMSWEADCDLCWSDSKRKSLGKIRLWKRINLWRGHDYYYDADAIREPHQDKAGIDRFIGKAGISGNDYEGRKWTERSDGLSRPPMTMKDREYNPAGRNKRSVWTIPTHPYPGPHYATFPPKLIEPMILAGTSPKVCAKCGAPWERVVQRVAGKSKECPKTQAAHEARGGAGIPTGTVGKSGGGRIDGSITIIGWRPACSCNAGIRPAVVLDPFAGTGTVAQKCIEHGRDYIMIDIDPKSIELAKKRTAAVQRRLM